MLHLTGSAFTSDWFAYIFIMDVYEKFTDCNGKVMFSQVFVCP